MNIQHVLSKERLIRYFRSTLRVNHNDSRKVVRIPSVSSKVPRVISMTSRNSRYSNQGKRASLASTRGVSRTNHRCQGVRCAKPRRRLSFSNFRPEHPMFLTSFVRSIVVSLFTNGQLNSFSSQGTFISVNIRIKLFITRGLGNCPLTLFSRRRRSRRGQRGDRTMGHRTRVSRGRRTRYSRCVRGIEGRVSRPVTRRITRHVSMVSCTSRGLTIKPIIRMDGQRTLRVYGGVMTRIFRGILTSFNSNVSPVTRTPTSRRGKGSRSPARARRLKRVS